METKNQSQKTLSKEKVKAWVRSRMDRGRWIYVADIPHLEQYNYPVFVDIVKEMIDQKDYGDQEIWIELDSWHERIKIFDYSGLYKQKQLWKLQQLSSNQETPGASRMASR